jgi:hypothetical protein
MAGLAFAVEGKVLAGNRESVLVFEAFGELLELVAGDFDDRLAVSADQVAVFLVGEVEGGGAVSEVDVGDDTEVLEGAEGAVDGGLGHVGETGAYLPNDVFGAQVTVVGSGQEDLDGSPPGSGDPPSAGPELGYYSLGRRRGNVVGPAAWT